MARVAPAIARLSALSDEERKVGPFVLIRQLGKGGFAPVWLAREVYGGTEVRMVALKVFALDDGTTATGAAGETMRKARRDTIFGEARALCQVEHPNIVRFFAIATDETAGVLGLAMECLNGKPLDRKIADAGKLDVYETLAVGCAVASALAAVHANGLVHCDIKPANVIDTLSVYKLIDFGIAAGGITVPRARRRLRRTSTTQSTMTPPPAPAAPLPLSVLDDLPFDTTPVAGRRGTTGLTTSGTPGYMDPAAVQSGAPATASSDLYSLGVMLFECLTGELPAVAAARIAGMGGLKPEVLDGSEAAPPLATIAPSVPAPIARLVDGLLERDPARRPRSAEIVAWELERIRRDLAGRARPLPSEELGPFRGLGRFEQSDRDVYFGRSSEIASGLEMVRRRGVVALIGPSGSGKSSLARAGLIPAIVDGELSRWPKEWDAAVVQPGEDPRSAIGNALDPFVEDAATMEPEALAAALADSVAESGRGVVLLVDQLEELVTMARGPSRVWATAFLARLGAQALPGVRCIVAARRDLLDELLALDELGRALTHATLLVTPLTDAAWEEVLDHALEVYGYALEDAEMRRALLDQLKGTTGAMPLVQFALTRLWERRDRERHIVPRAALDAIGGIGGALEAHADATLAKVGGAEVLPAVRSVLLSLTTAQGTRATHPRKDLESRAPGAQTAAIIDAFLEARLLVSEPEGLTLAHDALLARWGVLRRWIAEAREDRMRAEEIEREAAAWLADQRAPERLLKKRRLFSAEDLLLRGTTPLGEQAVELIHASRRARRTGQLLSAAPVALIVLVVAGVLLARWDAHRLKQGFCSNLILRRQVPECIHQATKAEVAHRALSARIATRGDRVESVAWVNGLGQPALNDVGYARFDYRYDAAGQVQEIDCFDAAGNLGLKRMLRDDAQHEERVDAFDLPLPLSGYDEVTGERRNGVASVIKYTYDPRGFVLTERYFSKFGDKPRTDHRKAFGYAYVRDARGEWTSADVLGEDGKVASTAEGFAHVTSKYDERGDQTERAFLDLAGRPTFLKSHVSTIRFDYDGYGNEIARSFYGSTGDTLATNVWGYARLSTKYDDHGNAAERWYLDRAGKPTMAHTVGTLLTGGFAGTVSSFDAKGNEIETAFMGPDRKPVYIPAGYARLRRVFDARGDIVELDLLDVDGKLTLDDEGKAIILQRFDDRGHVIERTYLGVDHEPATIRGGFARTTSRYERDREVEDAFFGLDGELYDAPGDGDFARVVVTLDDTGNAREVVYYGLDGEPVLRPQHYAEYRMAWTDGWNTETSFFGVDGKPTLGTGNFFLDRQKYDDGGDLLEDAFFATDSKTPAEHWGAARHTLQYDTRGRLVGERYFGTDGGPILAGRDEDDKALLANGFARRSLAYDPRGNLVEERFFGVDDAPIRRRDVRYARRAFEYDDRGNRISEAYFATDGTTPTRSASGVAGWRARYDDDGREVWKEYFDVDGKAMYSSGGYVSHTVAYDAAGHETERRFFDADGGPAAAKLADGGYAARVTTAYDRRGDAVETAYFGLDGAPTLHLGFARRVRTYDERGRELEDACLGVDGHPVLCPEGYAKRTRALDGRGSETRVAFFDAGGQPLADKRGVAVEKSTYDALGHLTERRYEGPGGHLIAPSTIGYARLTARFDAVGNELSRAYFGADDAPVAKDGAARVEASYLRGKPVDVHRFGPDGEPLGPGAGYAHFVSKFDGGHEVTRAIFDASDAPTLDPEGWSSWTAAFDPGGNETAKAYFDREGKPVVTRKGFARTSARYDEANHLVERQWFDAGDKPIAVEGVAREVARFDEWGYEAERSYFGADGKPVKKNGYAKLRTSRDRQGRVVEIAYYGTDGKLVRRQPDKDDDVDYARVSYKLDARGNYSEVAYFGPDNLPMSSQHGYASWEINWDDQNHATEESYFDAHGKPAKDQYGVHTIHMDHDAWGNEVKRAFLDETGKQSANRDGLGGWLSEWDTHGHETKRSLFGKNGEPVAHKGEGWSAWTSTRDAQGHEVAHALFGTDGKPFALATEGWAMWTRAYDAYGKETAFATFGVDGKPVALKGETYARLERKYQGAGQLTEQVFYDVDGKPTAGPNGWAVERNTYDPDGRQRSVAHFKADGKPWSTTTGRPRGWARWEAEYDMRGRVKIVRYFDAEDGPLAACATEKWVYDEASARAPKHVCSSVQGAETDTW